MELFLESLAKLDLATIITLLGGVYLINKSNQDATDAKLNDLSTKIDKMQDSITDIDRRLCRLEGAFASKECCAIKDPAQMRKSE